MDSFRTNPPSTGPQLVPPPPPPPYRSPIACVFLGRQGLRAGWRLLLYAIAVVILLAISSYGLHAIFGSAPGIDSPLKAMTTELFMFLSVAIPAVVASRLEQRPWGAYGLPMRRGAGRHFLTGLPVGFGALSALLLMIYLARGMTLGSPQLQGGELARYAFLWAVTFVLVGLAEEFMFRGYSQFTLATGMGFWGAGILLSVLFGAVHLNNVGEDWLGALNAGLVALIFLFSLWRTGSLWFAVGAHAAWDWGESFFYGVPDSGTKSVGTLFNPHFSGSKWITGGSVGPEGSVFALIALALMVICIHWLYPKRQWRAD